MFEVRFHGRGGEGVMTGAELLSVAAFLDGKYAQAFPSYGAERAGAPVVAFCRIDDKDIRQREPINEPDALVVQDPTLFKSLHIAQGLKGDGYLIVNSARALADIHLDDLAAQLPAGHALATPATEIAIQHIRRPAPTTALIGAFAAEVGIVSLDSVCEAIRLAFAGDIGAAHVEAAKAAHDLVKSRAASC